MAEPSAKNQPDRPLSSHSEAEVNQELQEVALQLSARQLVELAEFLKTLATNAGEILTQRGDRADLTAQTRYYEAPDGSIYRRCGAGETSSELASQDVLILDSPTSAVTFWQRVRLGEVSLSLEALTHLPTSELVTRAETLSRLADQFSRSQTSLSTLIELNQTLADVWNWLRADPGSPRQKITTSEPLLFEQDSITAIPTAAAIVSSIYAQLRKDLWQQDDQGFGYFQHRAKGNPNNYVEHYISNPGDIEILPWEQAEQIIDKFGFTTVKLHLLFAAHTMSQAEPWKSSFVLRATDIAHELGWDRRTDLPNTEKLNEIAKAASVLDCLLVKSVWVEGRSQRGKIDASTPTGRMWNVVVEPYGQLDTEGKMSRLDEVYLLVQPGLIFERFLNKAGSKLKQALYQFGYIAQEVLTIDPYHDELALRLAIHLTMDSRIHPSGRYQVGKLLETILPQTIIDTAQRDYRRAFDLKKRWDKALQLLMRLNWRIEFDDETYLEALRPDSKQRSPRGYFKKLLAAIIVIKPRAPIPELITTKREARSSKPALRPADRLSGDQIRQARIAKGWNQRQLAGWMGISQTLINHWEKERRTPNPEQEGKLRNLLEITS